ncbi:MAG: FecR domain-containing protein [Bacteroidales bacterium]|jgi:ferric-dicitrate binding protein FerR (iron transport regulator)|nr:FecR domain-containing protein [Bacteroidales bacterium]
MKKRSDIPEDLIVRYMGDDLSDEERESLVLWVSESDDNRRIFKEFRKVWILKCFADEDFDSEKAWENVSKRVGRRKVKDKKLFISWMSVAASVIVLIALWFVMPDSNVQSGDVRVKVLAGEFPEKVILPDSTVVWVNSDSELIYPVAFAENERSVTFNGEGYFEVTKNKQKPFVIYSDNTITKVLGTSFNLNTRVSEHKSELVVITGKVKFENRITEASVELEADDKGIVDVEENTEVVETTTPAKTKIDNYNVIAWKTKEFEFDETRLDDILREIEKVYHIEIEVEDEELLSVRVTTSFSALTAEDILEVLSDTIGFDYILDDEGTYIIEGVVNE